MQNQRRKMVIAFDIGNVVIFYLHFERKLYALSGPLVWVEDKLLIPLLLFFYIHLRLLALIYNSLSL